MKTRSSILLLFLVCAVVLAGPGPIVSGKDAGKDAARFFPKDKLMEIGVYYYPEHWPEAEWDRDLANIASLGFAFVHMAEFSWVFVEPRDGRLEREIVRQVYRRAGIGIADLPEGVYVEWREGFFVAVNYSSTSFTLPLPAGAGLLIGDKRLDPADVCVWMEK